LPQLRLDRGEPADTQGASRSIDGLGVSHAPCGKLKPGPGRAASEVARHQRARIQRAMVEVAFERGYEAVTARELARVAGVSTRTFYSHYSSKEECLLATHQLIVSKVLRNLDVTQAAGVDSKERLQLAIEKIVREWGSDPRAAHLMLIDIHTAGPLPAERSQRAKRSIEAKLREGVASVVDSSSALPLLIEGVVAGLFVVARSRLLNEQQGALVNRAEDLAQWATSLLDVPAGQRLNELSFTGNPVSLRVVTAGEGTTTAQGGDLHLLLSAIAKLAAKGSEKALTPRAIATAAGVSQRSFYVHFSGVEDCFVAALETRATQAIERTRRAGEGGLTFAVRTYRAVAEFCDAVAEDRAFATLCFNNIAATGILKMRCHERLMSDIGNAFQGGSAGSSVNSLAMEASVGAIWEVLREEVSLGRAAQAPRLSALFTFLILAPAIGSLAALDAIYLEETLHSERREYLNGAL
jgi:AcrR family transcriptional regulator